MSLQIKQGSIKYGAGKIFDNPYQPGEQQQNIVCTMDDGSEEKLYFRVGRTPHSQLRPGDRIQIVYETGQDGKRKRRLVAEVNGGSGHFVPTAGDVPVKPVHQQQGQNYPPEWTKKYQQPASISANAFINKKLAIMHKVMDIVKQSFPDFSEESVRAISTSILIEGDRKNIAFEQLLVTQEQIVPTVPTVSKEVVNNNPYEDPVPF